MTITRLALPGPAGAASLALATAAALVACAGADTPPTSRPAVTSPPPGASQTATPAPTPRPTPTPTPAPTPRFTNEPDDDLAELIPREAAGAEVVVAPFEEFALTPGDVGTAFGEIGDRFASLVVAYVEQPRTTLYAVRVDGDDVETEELEPHLATAGRYVGVAGLDPDAWELVEAGGHRVWARGEDNATAAGTTIYTWSSGEHVFLLIGVDDAVNRAIIEQLPGEAAPSPSPAPTEEGSPGPAATEGG